MAGTAVPIADNDIFLTNNPSAPSDDLSQGLAAIPGSQYDMDEYDDDSDAQEGSECSEASAESEYAVDETVSQEMARLEDTFREIGMRFRMIARIGEGITTKLVPSTGHSNYLLTSLYRNFLNRIQG